MRSEADEVAMLNGQKPIPSLDRSVRASGGLPLPLSPAPVVACLTWYL